MEGLEQAVLGANEGQKGEENANRSDTASLYGLLCVKNILVCCDGINNQLHGDLTNVARLFGVVVKDESQVAFYDPGVGTF